MTSLARFHSRSPRYTLNTEDDSLIRVAGPKQTPWEEGTEIKNVSLTGLAFLAPSDLCPVLGEVIRIQFTPPGAKQVACYGIVTRMDDEGTESKLVAVHFYKMDMSHRIALAQGIARKIRDHGEHDRLEGALTPVSSSKSQQLPGFFFLGCIALVWLECLFLFIHYGYEGLFRLLRI